MPLYREFSLGTEGALEFRRVGDLYSDEKGMALVREAGHVCLAEKLVSVAVDRERSFLNIEIDRVTGAHDFALNPQASLTDLTRSDIFLLVKCILQRIAIRPAFKKYIATICACSPDNIPGTPAIRCIVDPIIAARRMRDIQAIAGTYGFQKFEQRREFTCSRSLSGGTWKKQ